MAAPSGCSRRCAPRRRLPRRCVTRLDVPVLCQGEERTAALVTAFAADPATCLFGTLSLWQGVDVPGDACQLVVIDRIPFPRPDDPLMSAQVAGRGRRGWQRVHDSRRVARRPAPRPGRRPADPAPRRQGRRRGAGLTAGDGEVRNLPPHLAAAVLADHRSRRRGQCTAAAQRWWCCCWCWWWSFLAFGGFTLQTLRWLPENVFCFSWRRRPGRTARRRPARSRCRCRSCP